MKENEIRENEETKYLNKLYQCAEMGVVGIENVIDKTHKEEFRNSLLIQKEEYEKMENEIVEILKKYGCEEKGIGKMAKKSSEMVSEVKTKMDDSDNQIAKMMMEGNNKGIIEITKMQNEYQGSDEELKQIIQKFLTTMEQNLEEMKKYL